ncbi:hypothetical protein J4218_04075 [Candidatus Pacearchaeota archaeon]|nr:hypothetical protein [Candidatus Pacearchaeota archaeon]
MVETLLLNKWIEKERFSYELFWPYQEPLNPEDASVDVYLKLPQDPKTYVGTYITPRVVETLRQKGEQVEQTDRIVPRISHKTLEYSIENLIIRERLNQVFTESEES